MEDGELEITPTEEITLHQSGQIAPINEESSRMKQVIKNDFDFARNNIKTVINTGMEAVENLARIAAETEAPRLYECLTNLLQINTINNKMLLDLDSSIKEMVDGKGDKSGKERTVTNNTLFVASTTDIQRMVEEKIKNGLKDK